MDIFIYCKLFSKEFGEDQWQLGIFCDKKFCQISQTESLLGIHVTYFDQMK